MQTVLHCEPNTVFAEAIVGEDGALRLKDATQFSFKPGELLALSISTMPPPGIRDSETLRGSVTGYTDPFGSAAESDDWEALR